MKQLNQTVLPAVRNMKDFDKALESDKEVIILLETRISQVRNLVRYMKKADKKVFVHVDLIQGLKTDEFAMEFIGQDIKPDGIITTRSNVITQAKKYNILAIQRLFLIDSHALGYNLSLIEKAQPDFIEVLPGVIPGMIREIKEKTGISVIAGGLIRTAEDVRTALESGAEAVTTSSKKLWTD